MNTDFLGNIGLTKSEIKVYLALLEQNSASATEISEKVGLFRKNTYDALNKLIKKGIVSVAKVEKKRIFTATNPQRLLDFVDIRKKEIQTILPELKALYKVKPEESEEVTVFKGIEGLKTIYELIIKAKSNYDTFGAGSKFKEVLPYYYPQFQKKKQENNITTRAIFSETERTGEFIKDFLGETRFISKKGPDMSTTIIFGNKIAIMAWKEKPIGILIESKETAESYRFYFEQLWNIAAK